MSEHLAKYRDNEIVVIIASVGKAGELPKREYTCGVCGFVMNEVGECPRCKLQVEEGAQGLRRRKLREDVLREIGQIVQESWDDSEPNEGEGEHT